MKTLALVYDAGVLIAADRNDRAIWAEQRVRLSAGIIPLVPANVVAQVSRSNRQVQLRRFLRGCEVVPFDEASAHEAGALLAKSGTADVVDASVVQVAGRVCAEIVTTDPHDIGRLVSASSVRIAISRR
ncbi:MAG TPA: PIN domain-containing protein [Polyangiaceae bacterium]|nr:PIN domain-containing protein [Polyangiaceae bacterium]